MSDFGFNRPSNNNGGNSGTGDGTNVDLSSYAKKNNPKFNGSVSMGRNADSNVGVNSTAMGDNVEASGDSSHAEGYNTEASGYTSHAEGYEAIASGETSHAEGYSTEASGINSHAEGSNTTASDNASHAEGSNTEASGYASHAEGTNTKASGDYSHTEGSSTEASGNYSHAEGSYAKAQNTGTHAEGYYTVASGEYSHAEGSQTYATQTCAHTEGMQTRANGEYSHAEGLWTTANGVAQHVQGKYNIADTEGKYAHIVGNGKYENGYKYSNAHTLDWDGNAWYAGQVQGTNLPWSTLEVGELIIEQTVLFEAQSDGTGIGYTNDIPLTFAEGEKICFTFDDEQYICETRRIDEYDIYIGNGTLSGYDEIHNNEPFGIDFNRYGDIYIVRIYTIEKYAGLEVPVKIEKATGELHKLDEKFLPDTVATKEYVDGVMASASVNAVNAVSMDYVEGLLARIEALEKTIADLTNNNE